MSVSAIIVPNVVVCCILFKPIGKEAVFPHMTLDRSDILTKCVRGRSKVNTVFASGYIQRTINSNRIYCAVLFHSGIRFKGYFDIADLIAVLNGKLDKVKIKQVYPKKDGFFHT